MAAELHSSVSLLYDHKLWTFAIAELNNSVYFESTNRDHAQGGGGGGALRISIDGNDRMGVKIKTSKNSQGFQNNLKKFLDQKLTLKYPPLFVVR